MKDLEQNKEMLIRWAMFLRAFLKEPDDAKAKAALRKLIDEVVKFDQEN